MQQYANKYTSRSQIEDYQKCPRLRYWRQFYKGKGITPSRKSIPLSTGSCIHAGVEYLFGWAKHEQGSGTSSLEWETAIENAVTAGKKLYYELVFDSGFMTGNGTLNDINQRYTYNEQVALTEALIRAWAMKELPYIIREYEIVGTEKEITVNLPGTDIVFQARVDAELKHRGDGSYYNYSLKTAKMWNERSDKSYRKDLQGLTEIWAVENEREGLNGFTEGIIHSLEQLRSKNYILQQNVNQITNFLNTKLPTRNKVVDAVKFCFLIKGYRRESGKDFGYYSEGDKSGRYVTYNPLIRGYKNITTTGVSYAHSYKFLNSNNKSGMGALGKGWEPFNVWEDAGVGGVRGWIEMLEKQTIQPECGDIIKSLVITPISYDRNKIEVDSAIGQITNQEKIIFDWIQGDMWELDKLFPQYRHSCHWPSDCEMLDACWKPEVNSDPVGSGLYQIRTPHHQAEKESFE